MRAARRRPARRGVRSVWERSCRHLAAARGCSRPGGCRVKSLVQPPAAERAEAGRGRPRHESDRRGTVDCPSLRPVGPLVGVLLGSTSVALVVVVLGYPRPLVMAAREVYAVPVAVCGNRRAKNRAGKKLCTECGTLLALVCPACGAAIAATEEFSAGCGPALGERGDLRSNAARSGTVRGATQRHRFPGR